jgi:hypothetical protein
MRLCSRAQLIANPVLPILLALALAGSLGAASARAEPGLNGNAASQAAEKGTAASQAMEKGTAASQAVETRTVKETAPVAVARPTAIYVIRGRVVQVIRPSAAVIGSLSFRVLSSNRLGSQLRGMLVTVALAAPVRLTRGTTIVVHLRAPVDVLSSGFGDATTVRMTSTS